MPKPVPEQHVSHPDQRPPHPPLHTSRQRRQLPGRSTSQRSPLPRRLPLQQLPRRLLGLHLPAAAVAAEQPADGCSKGLRLPRCNCRRDCSWHTPEAV